MPSVSQPPKFLLNKSSASYFEIYWLQLLIIEIFLELGRLEGPHILM